MSLGFSIAIAAFPFFDLLDKEVEQLVQKAMESGSAESVALYNDMDASRRRLAQSVDVFARSLPSQARHDATISRSASYALVALADERMLHYSSGALQRWRERLLEHELYGSALAGQEIVSRAQAAAQGSYQDSNTAAVLTPLYLAILRSGFEGSLRGDVTGLSLLINSLEQSIGTHRDRRRGMATDSGPRRSGFSPFSMAAFGLLLWLLSGLGVWFALPFNSLQQADHLTDRISSGLPVLDDRLAPLTRSTGPSRLPAQQEPNQDEVR